jgi:hypothetical protein
MKQYSNAFTVSSMFKRSNGAVYQTVTDPYNSKPFEDNFPEWNGFRKLCEDYPGLEKAYENLKTIYTIVYADSLLPKEDK